ncbi:MAG: AMP-binding protein [Candidatus Mycalebacterium zealandia]|nr:MAG: AMP-binding protein [Candidatus Mycalebacterium zealandia]
MERHGGKSALTDSDGEHSHSELLEMSAQAAGAFLRFCGTDDLSERRVAFMLPKSAGYAALKLGIWRAGGVCVPLCVSHPPAEIAYVVDDSAPSLVVCHPSFREKIEPICSEKGVVFALSDEFFQFPSARAFPDFPLSRRAMMIYTSGTTSRPKGVVTTHSNIDAQINAMLQAWEWTDADRVLNVLPLHHLHGILNLLLCPLSAGALCEMADFDPGAVWERFRRGGITVFMAVPTVYAKLAQFWENAPADDRKDMSRACAAMRLMVSGSAALTVRLSLKWRDISGHTLLERYGMTETGMILSNPLKGKRKPGFVGKPMPGVRAKLFTPEGAPAHPGEQGEVRVKGAGVFLEYWNNSRATRGAFLDGWFKTGDMAALDSEGDFQMFGRESVDIIKSGGYKISALEVEREILEKNGVAACAVVGVEDGVWGQRVAAVVALENGKSLSLTELKQWLEPRLAPYKIPSLLENVDELPVNALGKVQKPELVKIWEGEI